MIKEITYSQRDPFNMNWVGSPNDIVRIIGKLIYLNPKVGIVSERIAGIGIQGNIAESIKYKNVNKKSVLNGLKS